MRPIHLVALDKTRPALLLTRSSVRDRLTSVTVAPITSTRRGLTVEVPVGSANGLDHESVVSCDGITTVPVDQLGRQVGWLFGDQEVDLARALVAALDLRVEELD